MLYDANTDAPFQIEILEDVTAEPVTLEDVKKFSHVDTDYAANDTTIEIMMASAREKLEALTNTYFAVKKVKVQFYGASLQLPNGPTHEILEVTKNNEIDPLDTDKYNILGLNYKTIFLKEGEYGIDSWFYPVWGGYPYPWIWAPGQCNFYNVTYNTGFETLPKVLKHALLMLIDYFLKEQGTTDLEIPPAIIKLVNTYSRNLPIQ